MRDDLLAPPRLSIRAYAAIISSTFLLILAFGAAMGRAALTLPHLALNAVIIAALAAAAIWTYSRLLRLARRSGPERMPLIHSAVSAASFIAAQLALVVASRGTSSGLDLSLLWMVPFMVGTTLATAGWSRRIGDSLHCPKCEYEFTFTSEPPDRTPIHCPECGTPWLGLLKQGRRVRSPRIVAAGIALALGGFLFFNPIIFMTVLAPRLPTPLLVGTLYLTPRDARNAWTESATRPLDPHWIEVVARRALAIRAAGHHDRDATDWLDKMITAGKLPADLKDRFYREALHADVLVPDRVRRGEPFTAHLRITRAVKGDNCLGLMFAGYAVEGVGEADAPPHLGRQVKTLWAHEIDPDYHASHLDILPQVITAPDQPGELRVRAVYWVVHQPSFHDELAWQPDGTPTKPTAATWFERVELERVVRVE